MEFNLLEIIQTFLILWLLLRDHYTRQTLTKIAKALQEEYRPAIWKLQGKNSRGS